MLLRSYLIILVILGLSAGGFAVMIGEMTKTYGSPVDTTFNQTFNKIEQTKNLTTDITEGIGAETETGLLGILDVVISGAWKSLKVMVSSIDIFSDLLKDLADVLHIPVFIVNGVALVIGIAILFGILSTAFRRKI